MITVKYHGDFKNTKEFLKKASKLDISKILDEYGRAGVSALSATTPVDTGLTANSWNYEVSSKNGAYSIAWTNSNVVNGVPIAIILQYGHGTRNGGFVQGRDYINPAIQPIFDKIANGTWEEVTHA